MITIWKYFLYRVRYAFRSTILISTLSTTFRDEFSRWIGCTVKIKITSSGLCLEIFQWIGNLPSSEILKSTLIVWTLFACTSHFTGNPCNFLTRTNRITTHISDEPWSKHCCERKIPGINFFYKEQKKERIPIFFGEKKRELILFLGIKTHVIKISLLWKKNFKL